MNKFYTIKIISDKLEFPFKTKDFNSKRNAKKYFESVTDFLKKMIYQGEENSVLINCHFLKNEINNNVIMCEKYLNKDDSELIEKRVKTLNIIVIDSFGIEKRKIL